MIDARTEPGDTVATLMLRDLDGDRLGCRAE
jgi:hypothetical protein